MMAAFNYGTRILTDVPLGEAGMVCSFGCRNEEKCAIRVVERVDEKL